MRICILMGHVPHMLAYGCFTPLALIRGHAWLKECMKPGDVKKKKKKIPRRVLCYPFGMLLIKNEKISV
jgi:hypothetical protein